MPPFRPSLPPGSGGRLLRGAVMLPLQRACEQRCPPPRPEQACPPAFEWDSVRSRLEIHCRLFGARITLGRHPSLGPLGQRGIAPDEPGVDQRTVPARGRPQFLRRVLHVHSQTAFRRECSPARCVRDRSPGRCRSARLPSPGEISPPPACVP